MSAISINRGGPPQFKLGRHDMKSMTKHKIPATLIPGDGIGPEVVAATVQVLDALGSPFVWAVQHPGIAGATHSGDPLPDPKLAIARKLNLPLKAPLPPPTAEGFPTPPSHFAN